MTLQVCGLSGDDHAPPSSDPQHVAQEDLPDTSQSLQGSWGARMPAAWALWARTGGQEGGVGNGEGRREGGDG